MPLPLIDSPIPNDHSDCLSVLGRAASRTNRRGVRGRPIWSPGEVRETEGSKGLTELSPRGRFKAVASIYSGIGTVGMRGKIMAESVSNVSRTPARRGPEICALLGTQLLSRSELRRRACHPLLIRVYRCDPWSNSAFQTSAVIDARSTRTKESGRHRAGDDACFTRREGALDLGSVVVITSC